MGWLAGLRDLRLAELLLANPPNRDRGRLRSPTPPTPPYLRVRIRRFSNLGPGGLEVRNPFRRCWFHRSPGPFRASPSPHWASSTAVDGLVPDPSGGWSPTAPITVRAFVTQVTTMPSADFCRPVTPDCSRVSLSSRQAAALPR